MSNSETASPSQQPGNAQGQSSANDAPQQGALNQPGQASAQAPASGTPGIEHLGYAGMDIPIFRQSSNDLFVALQPPQALPYVMAPHGMPPQQIVDFFAAHVPEVEDMRAKMIKRFQKSPSMKCLYRTGDVAYVMGRPFMLHVNPLKMGGGMSGKHRATRGRATVKFEANTDISKLTLYVVNPRSYDQVRTAFLSYANRVIMNNAVGLVGTCMRGLAEEPPAQPIAVRMKPLRHGWSHYENGCLWLSDELVAYPVDCLVWAIWTGLAPLATKPEPQQQEYLASMLPGWKRASEILANREEPFSNQ